MFVQAREDHSCDPKRDDIPTRDECARGVKMLELRRFFWPTQR